MVTQYHTVHFTFLAHSQVGREVKLQNVKTEVIKAIQPFVSPFYDRMPGLISVVDPPFVAKKARIVGSLGDVWRYVRDCTGGI